MIILMAFIYKMERNSLQNEKNPEISCRFRDFFLPLPSLNIIVRYRTRGGERRPSNYSGHFLCSLILPRTHDPHYTNSGGHPVDIYVLGRSL